MSSEHGLTAFLSRLQQPDLLGTTENELGIRKWLEDQGHTLVTTSDKEGENSTFDKELVDAEVIITTPCVIPRISWPCTPLLAAGPAAISLANTWQLPPWLPDC